MSKKQLTPQLTPIARALRTAATVLTGSTMLWPGVIPANPSGGQVVGGQAQITNPVPGGTVINQQSNAAIINWQNFSIGDGEYVMFNQPSVSAATLNRVIGNLPSEILGNLTANGRVFVINPQGVMFGANSRVDVGALVTSTGNISNEDFLAGRLKFSGDSSASIVNRGQISAANGGFVVLSADKVSNSGTISAPNGDVLLAAGRQLSLQLDPEGLVSYSVDAAAASAAAGVENFGDIIANGGAVVMAASVARKLIGTAINNSGRVTANAIQNRGGEIFLVAEGGNIEQRGSLDASSVQGDGGTIDIRSDRNILLAAGSTTDASGRNGGEAVAVAGQQLNYERGASMSVADRGAGRGGFAELSGREVQIRNTVNLGNDGELLIDPVDLLVSNAGGNILYTDLMMMLNNGNVTIEAENSVVFAAYGGFFSTYSGGALIVNAGVPTVCVTPLCSTTPAAPTHAPGIFFDGASDTFSIYGGLQLTSTVASSQIISLANLISSGNTGSITISAPGNIDLKEVRSFYGGGITITSDGGSVTTTDLYAENDISITGATTVTTGTISRVDDLRLTTTSGDVRTNLNFSGGNTVDVQSGGAAYVNGSNAQTYGAFKVTAAGNIELLTYTNVDGFPALGDLSAGSIDATSSGGSIDAGNLNASSTIDLEANGGSLFTGNVGVSAGTDIPATVKLTARDAIYANQITASSYGGAVSVTVTANAGNSPGNGSQIDIGDISLTNSGFGAGGSATLVMSNTAGAAGAGGGIRTGQLTVSAASPAAASASLSASGTIDSSNDGSNSGLSATVSGNTASLTLSSSVGDVVVDDINVSGSTQLSATTGSVRSLSAFDGVSTIETASLSVQAATIDLSNDDTFDTESEMSSPRTTNLLVGGGTAAFGTDTPFVTLNIDDDPETDVESNSRPELGLPTLPAAPNAAFESQNDVRLGNLAISGSNNNGYLFVRAPNVDVDSLTDGSGTAVPLAAFNFRPYSNSGPISVDNFTGDLQNNVLNYLLGGTGYKGNIDISTQIVSLDCGTDCISSDQKNLGSANYILYTTGAITGTAPEYGASTTGQVIVLKATVPQPTPTPTPVVTPTPEPEPTPTPTPVVTPTPTPVVTPTPTPVVTPTPTPVVTPTPTPVVTPTPSPVVTPTPTPVVTPTPTPVVTPTPTPTPLANMGEIMTALAEASKIDDPFLEPSPDSKPGEGEIQRRDTSYQIGEFSCDATGVQ